MEMERPPLQYEQQRGYLTSLARQSSFSPLYLRLTLGVFAVGIRQDDEIFTACNGLEREPANLTLCVRKAGVEDGFTDT